MKAPPRQYLELALGFVCVFVGLSLPSPWLGRLYVTAHAALGNALLPSELASGVELAFQVSEATAREHAWSLPLLVTPPHPGAPLTVPMDLRTLSYLPTACFAALAVATPLASPRKNAALLLTGLLILQPLLLVLNALPVVSFLGGTGPITAFALSLPTHTVLQLLYRALVASPGMAYAIPFFLWWVLLRRRGGVGALRARAAPQSPAAEPLTSTDR